MRGFRLSLLALALAFGGCSMKTMALRSTVALLDEGSLAFDEEPDPKLARESLGGQLKLVEALLRNEPGNRELLLLASRGFGGFAFLFIEDSEPERAKGLYLRGKDYAARLLSRDKAMASALALPPQELEAALKKAAKRDVPALFWLAYNWAAFINLSRDSPDAVADLPKAVALMKRVHELQPDYYFAGADLFFGAYFASRPKILGGDTAKAKDHFAWARRINGGKFLIGDVLEARYLSVAEQDKERYESLLKSVQSAPAGTLPGARLADEVAKEKAKALLEKTNDYF